MNRAQFVEDRRKGIGGSDVAAILGLDPYKTPYQLWREKRAMDADAAGAAARRGQFLEPAILARYNAELAPHSTRRPVSLVWDWRRGNIDELALFGSGEEHVVEAKSVTREVFRRSWGEPWTDQVPDRALCQGLWYGSLSEAKLIDFAVAVIPDDPDLVLGCTADEVMRVSDFHVFRVARNARVEQQLVHHAAAFWHNHVLAGVAPDAINEADAELRWPLAIAGVTKPGEPVRELLEQYEAAGEAEKQAKAARGKLRERLALYVEDAEAIVAPDGRTPWLTCKSGLRSAYTVPEAPTRTLRFTKWWRKLSANNNKTEGTEGDQQ